MIINLESLGWGARLSILLGEITLLLQILHVSENMTSFLSYKLHDQLYDLLFISKQNQLKVLLTGCVQTWSIVHSFLTREFLAYKEKAQLYKNICAAKQLLYLRHPENKMLEWEKNMNDNKSTNYTIIRVEQ